MIYRKIIRPLMFMLSPERAHRITIAALRAVGMIPGSRWLMSRLMAVRDPALEREVVGV